MESERRRAERNIVHISVHWQGLLSERKGHISDISATGCFVLSGGDLSPGELISLEMELPGVMKLRVWAKVVYVIPEMGFAVRFRDMTNTDETRLERLIELAKTDFPMRDEIKNPTG